VDKTKYPTNVNVLLQVRPTRAILLLLLLLLLLRKKKRA